MIGCCQAPLCICQQCTQCSRTPHCSQSPPHMNQVHSRCSQMPHRCLLPRCIVPHHTRCSRLPVCCQNPEHRCLQNSRCNRTTGRCPSPPGTFRLRNQCTQWILLRCKSRHRKSCIWYRPASLHLRSLPHTHRTTQPDLLRRSQHRRQRTTCDCHWVCCPPCTKYIHRRSPHDRPRTLGIPTSTATAPIRLRTRYN